MNQLLNSTQSLSVLPGTCGVAVAGVNKLEDLSPKIEDGSYVQTVKNIGRFEQVRQGRNNQWQALGSDGHGADVFVATDVISMQTDLFEVRAPGDATPKTYSV